MRKNLVLGVAGLATIAVAAVGGIKIKQSVKNNAILDQAQQAISDTQSQWAKIDLSENKILITGTTVDADKHKALIQQLSQIEDVESVTSKVQISSPIPLDQCQQQIDSILNQNDIEFDKANEKVNAQSHDALKQIAELMWLCPNKDMVVIGHTDNQSSAEENQQISEQRSKAVVNYFFDQLNLSDLDMVAIGMGAAFPIVINDSDENRDLNERIEIKIR